MSTIGDKICQMRKALGLTQEELAKRMGYKSKSTINKIELGINDIPQNKIVKFAEVLQTTPSNLMGWEDQQELNLQLFSTPPAEKRESKTVIEPKLADGEKALLELFRLVPKDKQELVLQMIRVALKTK